MCVCLEDPVFLLFVCVCVWKTQDHECFVDGWNGIARVSFCQYVFLLRTHMVFPVCWPPGHMIYSLITVTFLVKK